MRLNTSIKSVIIVILIFYSVFTSSDAYFCNKSEGNSKVRQEYLIDDYKKYAGEKIALSNQTANISGQFGNLELTSFIVQPSTDFILNQINYNELFDMFESSRQWIFKNTTLKKIRLLFRSAGLDDNTCNELMIKTNKTSDGYVTNPGDSFFWKLTPEIKSKLYPLIGNYNDNTMYAQPLYFYSDSAYEWFYNSGLDDDIKEKILSLTYSKSGVMYLSDTHLILPYLNNDDQRVSFLKAAFRIKSMDVMLKINEGQNVSDIAEYWGSLGRTSDIKPLLENLSKKSGGGKISIEKLLPAIPKERINTYCGAYEYETDWKDCHWTTINFFNNKADERYYDFPDTFSFISEISNPLKKDSKLKFGDIICIFNKNNGLVHSCIYIADNLVITKNGMGNLNPFVFSYLDKTISLYGDESLYLSRKVADTYSIKL